MLKKMVILGIAVVAVFLVVLVGCAPAATPAASPTPTQAPPTT